MGKQNSRRAAIYLRISLDPTGDGLAVERQRQDCERIVKERGWKVVETYVDESKSAYSKNVKRKEYDRMVYDFKAGKFDALVVWDLDRLTRQPRQLEDWIDAAEESGLILVTANGEADLSTDGGRLYARVKVSVARGESERKGRRQQRAAQQRAEMGRPPKGIRLTGYDLNGKTIKSEAKIVKQVFARFLAGEALYSIAKWLDGKEVPTRRGGSWSSSSVRTMLTNPRYAGLSTYAPNPKQKGKRERGVVGRGTWEALVSENDFALVQSKLMDPRRKTNRVGTDRKHLGSGIYMCDACGIPVRSWSGARYSCRKCGLTRAMAQVDVAVEIVVRERLADPRLLDALTPASSEELASLRKEAAKLSARQRRVESDYDQGIINGVRYRSAMDQVEASIAENLRKQSTLAGVSALTSTLASKDPVAAFDKGSLSLRRALVDALIEVRLKRAPRGRRTWDPDLIVMSPKRS